MSSYESQSEWNRHVYRTEKVSKERHLYCPMVIIITTTTHSVTVVVAVGIVVGGIVVVEEVYDLMCFVLMVVEQ